MKKDKSFYILISILFFVMWNCDVNETQIPTEEFSDDVVKTAVYSGPKYPSDFFYEDLSNVVLNYVEIWDVPFSTQPATVDYNIAVDYVHTRLTQLELDTTKLIDGQSTEKYFEFNWVPDSSVNHPPYIFRMHKNSYFEGVKYGRLDNDRGQVLELGKLNYRPITSQTVKEFFDRLWFFKNYNVGGSVVLKRTIFENINNYLYTIYYTRTVFGDYGLQDRIYLYKGEFQIDKSNGVSQVNYSLIKEVFGNSN
jgi:hypothetical protein